MNPPSPLPSGQAHPATAPGHPSRHAGDEDRLRIALNRPWLGSEEIEAAAEAVRSGRLEGGGPNLARAEESLRNRTGSPHVLATTSCTHALELMLMAHGIGPGDEVIVPAFTFPATATCVVRQHARVVFADSLPDNPNLDPEDVARRVTKRTRALILLHYGGIPCEVPRIVASVKDRGLLIFEDAAHAFDSRIDGKTCGTLGDGGCLSFHATKNITCGEGGALLLEDPAVAERARICREMGTDRAALRTGKVDRYTWLDVGSSFLPSDVLMAILNAQLAKADAITARRRKLFSRYLDRLAELGRSGRIGLPSIPRGAQISGHIFYILLRDAEDRAYVRACLDQAGIDAAPHYDAIDCTPFGSSLVEKGSAKNKNAAAIASRLLRLPIHPNVSESDQDRIVDALHAALRGR